MVRIRCLGVLHMTTSQKPTRAHQKTATHFDPLFVSITAMIVVTAGKTHRTQCHSRSCSCASRTIDAYSSTDDARSGSIVASPRLTARVTAIRSCLASAPAPGHALHLLYAVNGPNKSPKSAPPTIEPGADRPAPRLNSAKNSPVDRPIRTDMVTGPPLQMRSRPTRLVYPSKSAIKQLIETAVVARAAPEGGERRRRARARGEATLATCP
jgi:hypothetical protein